MPPTSLEAFSLRQDGGVFYPPEMKSLMLMFAVVLVGCTSTSTSWVSDPGNPQNIFVERVIRAKIGKSKGELTKEDLKKVNELFLADTKITDEGLMMLAKLKNLENINVFDTSVTEVGKAKLQKALPKCFILGP